MSDLERLGRKISKVGLCMAFVGLAMIPFGAMLGPGKSGQTAAIVMIFWLVWTGILILGGVAIQQYAEDASRPDPGL